MVEAIKDIAVAHGIQAGMMATGNYGRGLLRRDVSEDIVNNLVKEVNWNQ